MGEPSDIETLLKAHAIQERSKTSAPQRKSSAVESVKSHLGLVKDLGTIAAVIGAIVLWFQTRASREEVDQAKKECIATASSAIAAGLAPIPPRIKSIEKRLARDDQRWDSLDQWHSQAFATKRTTPPPKFGPAAEKRGEVRYFDVDEAPSE